MSVNFGSMQGAGPLGGAEKVLARMAGPWWMFLLTGIAWLIISVIVLRFRIASVATVGVLMGVVFLGGWVSELLNGLVMTCRGATV